MRATVASCLIGALWACSGAEPRPVEAAPAPPEDVPSAHGPRPEPPAPEPPDPATLAAGRRLAYPGPDGFLSTWMRLAASPESFGDDEVAGLDPADGEPVATTATMDLRGLAPRRTRSLALGATILVPDATRSCLLIGLRGAVTVWLDGNAVTSAESDDRFRAAFVLTCLDLGPGEHRLVLAFRAPQSGRWRAGVRVLDADGSPGARSVALALGRLDDDGARALAEASVEMEEHAVLLDGEPSWRLTLSRAGGGVPAPRPIAVHWGDAAGRLDLGDRFDATMPIPHRGRLPRLTIGDEARDVAVSAARDRSTLLAAATLDAAARAAPDASGSPIRWRRDEALRVVREHDRDLEWRRWLQAEARRIAGVVNRGRDPFDRLRGYRRMAFASRLDGVDQPYELFVPPAYRDSRAWPLLVTLHGFKGNAGDYFRNTFGLARDWENGETLEGHGRHGEAPTTGPMIVVAPMARGQAMYRHAGEVDVLEAMADVEARFRIDPRRVYITGGSMGGTGAAYLPFRHPGRFAAAAALAGYHDQRVREDTDHERLTDVERFLQARRSDVDWAENALHLPMLLVRGTRDRPLEWTRSLDRRLTALRYRHEHREPELGHNVWTETYADGAIFSWLSRHRTPIAPRRVRLRTARAQTNRAHWVRIDRRTRVDGFAEVDARLDDGVATVAVDGADAFTLSPEPPLLDEGAPLAVQVGEQRLTGPTPLTLVRDGASWTAGAPPPPRAVVETIRDLYREPLTFVVGTRDPAHTAMNRLVAEHWARPRGWRVAYPIVDDVALRPEDIRERSLVLIGPPASNAHLAEIANRLPIRFDGNAVVRGETRFAGPEVGTAFATLHPESGRPLLVIAGPHPFGTWRSLSLPHILPAFVIFDDGIAPARDGWSGGGSGGRYLDHGFFVQNELRQAASPP